MALSLPMPVGRVSFHAPACRLAAYLEGPSSRYPPDRSFDAIRAALNGAAPNDRGLRKGDLEVDASFVIQFLFGTLSLSHHLTQAPSLAINDDSKYRVNSQAWKMSLTQKPSSHRTASSTRLTVLLIVLFILGIGCIYEFAVARPAYSAAWDEIKKIDASSDSSNFTSEKITKLIGEPASIDPNYRDDCVVHTYRWPSGLLVKNHEIHIVFTKNNPQLSKKLEASNKAYEPSFYYYSAVAGRALDLENNFPIVKNTIIQNLNPPPVTMAGPSSTPIMPWNAVENLLKSGDEKGLPMR